MKIYNVLIHDRHVDPEIHNFRFETDAVSFARKIALERCRNPEDLEELLRLPNDWIFFITYSFGMNHELDGGSCEGDYVRVSIGDLK